MMQTSGPKAKLLTKTMVEDEMVGRCSGLRKSPWNNLYGEYFLPYLKMKVSKKEGEIIVFNRQFWCSASSWHRNLVKQVILKERLSG